MKYLFSIAFFVIIYNHSIFSQTLPPVFGNEMEGKVFHDTRVRSYLTPQRIIWKYDGEGRLIKNENVLLSKGHNGQGELSSLKGCMMKSTANERPSIVLDFGKEIQGGIQIVTTAEGGDHRAVRLHVRLGESVTEAMTPIGKKESNNDHASRDFVMDVPWLGVAEFGNSGYRFAYIELVEPNMEIFIKEINAIFVYRDIPYLGSFTCNDHRINEIWLTGAYTVHLNMQQYIWDGIKRDRLVWIGDMFPEVMTVNTVFGYNEVIPKSLDLAKDITPLPGWMNGISAYSLWWIICQHEWYRYQGDLTYLKQQQSYLTGLLHQVISKVDSTGLEQLDGWRFLDWASTPNSEGVRAGLQALSVMALRAGANLCQILEDQKLSSQCEQMANFMQKQILPHNHLKQGAALQALAGIIPAKQAHDEVIGVGGAKDFSTFYGYYMLQAQAKAGEYQAALDIIRQYWGGMLDMGATTFWEDFNVEWLPDAGRVDEIVPEGKKDIHADFGDYCYKQLRHSLCHGWASGPTAWLTEHVLGVQVVEPGCKILRVQPHLADLQWVAGTFPTPNGIVYIKHEKLPTGKIKSTIKAPKGVKIIR